MKKNYTILFLIPMFLMSQEKEFDKMLFHDLYSLRCGGAAKLHTFVNNTSIFHMIDEDDSHVTTYKINNEFDYNFFISVFNNELSGFRINTPNSYIYNYIINNGKFIEVHKEGNTSFLVYNLNNESFLLNSSVDSSSRKHYIIDFWCIK